MFNGDYSYSVTQKHGSNFALVGDASAFIDPIFASGVYLSMNSSRLVADAVHATLSSEGGMDGSAMENAYAMIDGAYALVDKAIRMFYNPVAINFAQIGSAAELIHRYHENALAVGHFLLAGDFFENHERYYRFLDLLSDPEILKLYRSTVIERPEFTAATCDASPLEIFAPLLAEHERRRELYPESPDLDLVIGPPQVLEGSVGEAPGQVPCPVHRGSRKSGKRVGKEPLSGQLGPVEVAACHTHPAHIDLSLLALLHR